MLNKQLWAAILPGGVRAKLNVIAFVLLAFVTLVSCEDPMNDITKEDNTEIRTGACPQGECGDGQTPPNTGG
ncbi:MAG: hypothetical protein R8G66_24550 [Cytophagales bacterium]|nr:hypothetical protein [Cytophagales bacterium]